MIFCNLAAVGSNEVTQPQVLKGEPTKKEQRALPIILGRLMDKDCLIKNGRGKYSLFTPLFAEYVKAQFVSE